MSDQGAETRADKVGVQVMCPICGDIKKPIGRSGPLGASYCTDECEGYRQPPYAGSLKLYLVRCLGMQDSHGTAYVIAPDSTSAYQRVRADLDARGLGFVSEREMSSVTLVAENAEYPACNRLYLPEDRHVE